jgi:hypothetical protein
MRKEKININTERDAVKRDIRKKIKTGSRKTKKVQQDNKER